MATEESRKLELPDRRKNTYDALEKHLDERLAAIEAMIQKWIKRGLYAFGFIGLTSALALAGFGYSLAHEKERSITLCENRNVRHDNAVTGLMVGSNQDQENATTEAAKTEIQRRRDVTLGIINGIAPKSDCENPDKVELIEPVVTAPPLPKPPTPTPAP